MQLISVLGSTGSIGVSTLDVISKHPDLYSVFAITANSSADKLYEQCLSVRPRYAVLRDPSAAEKLQVLLRDSCSNLKPDTS